MQMTAREKAVQYAEFGRQVSQALRDAIYTEAPSDYEELLAYAVRLHSCSNRTNIWLAEDLHSSDGECYIGSGRFWHCSHRLCAYCIARRSTHTRKLIRQSLLQQKLFVGENFKFLTFTIVNLGLPLLRQRDLINDTWALFRKRHWFESHIIGAAKTEEFTFTGKGYHYHLHVLARCRYIDYATMRRQWTSCARHIFRQAGIDLNIATKDGLLFANCRHISSLRAAVNELAKYVTKTTTWSKIPASDLLDFARVERFPRMFELLGSFRPPTSRKPSIDDLEPSDEAILDTKSLSDLREAFRWRRYVREHGIASYIDHLDARISSLFEVRAEQLHRRYPYALFWRLKPEKEGRLPSIIRRTTDLAPRVERREALESAQRRVFVGTPQSLYT